jgi:hypothetical protein
MPTALIGGRLAHVRDAPLRCFLGWRFWLCRKLEHGCLLTESLARPGGNATGFATMEVSVIGKMLQTLKEIAPNVAHVSNDF